MNGVRRTHDVPRNTTTPKFRSAIAVKWMERERDMHPNGLSAARKAEITGKTTDAPKSSKTKPKEETKTKPKAKKVVKIKVENEEAAPAQPRPISNLNMMARYYQDVFSLDKKPQVSEICVPDLENGCKFCTYAEDGGLGTVGTCSRRYHVSAFGHDGTPHKTDQVQHAEKFKKLKANANGGKWTTTKPPAPDK
eukprot:SAG11_NODE_3389_length_2479_cov_1.614286_2_plen_194_part_00